jgi:hypothetical protein
LGDIGAIMTTAIFHGAFETSDGTGVTGLSDVVITVKRTAYADGAVTELVAGAACTEVGLGIYQYRRTDFDFDTYSYTAQMSTASATPEKKYVRGLISAPFNGATPISANATKVNGVTLAGVGTVAEPWRPA